VPPSTLQISKYPLWLELQQPNLPVVQEDFLRRPERKWFTFKMLGHHTRGGFFVDREEISYKISCACQIPRSICNCREQFPHKN